MKLSVLFLVFLSTFFTSSYPQNIQNLGSGSYSVTNLSINHRDVRSLLVIKLNEEVSSADYNKYNSLLFPQDHAKSLTILSDDVRNLIAERHIEKNTRVLCFYLKDVKRTLLCLFDNQETMEATVGNTMLFAWANCNQLTPFHESAPKEYRLGGADLRGEDLKKRSSIIDGNTGVGVLESTFYKEIILPEIKKHGNNFSLISAMVFSNYYEDSWNKHVITHEILHAQYFVEEKFRKAVDDYFNPIFTNTKHKYYKLVTCIQKNFFDTGLYPGIYENSIKRNTELANVFLQFGIYEHASCGNNTNNPIAIELYNKITSSGVSMSDLYKALFEKKPVRPGPNPENEYFLYYSDINDFRSEKSSLVKERESVRSVSEIAQIE